MEVSPASKLSTKPVRRISKASSMPPLDHNTYVSHRDQQSSGEAATLPIGNLVTQLTMVEAWLVAVFSVEVCC